jgi:hypothetical protein
VQQVEDRLLLGLGQCPRLASLLVRDRRRPVGDRALPVRR